MLPSTSEPTSAAADTANLVEKLSRYEQLGQEVIVGKRALVELDERRQKCREATRQIQKQRDLGDSCWLCLGESSFIKVPTEKALSFLKEDVKTIEETVNFTREELKKKVDEVRRIEGSKNLSELGFLLRPVY
ncbi:unnamed protein product [Enterobius vermicularis]|uniref:P53 and DNA damage-regulated protein 1 n=1 Tax=Enterobius vermicularis TaxID=51028 RepID=A0A0N4VBU4_ENTVE|nr:unnamed protein product [Enterobius vermicularis]